MWLACAQHACNFQFCFVFPGSYQLTYAPSHISALPHILLCHTPGRWLTMLQLLLEPIGVPCNITVSGALRRVDRQERISFLSSVRNALLPPATPASQPADGRPLIAVDDVLFINDVFFCARDALRLVHLDADLACGLDYQKMEGQHGFDDVLKAAHAHKTAPGSEESRVRFKYYDAWVSATECYFKSPRGR